MSTEKEKYDKDNPLWVNGGQPQQNPPPPKPEPPTPPVVDTDKTAYQEYENGHIVFSEKNK